MAEITEPLVSEETASVESQIEASTVVQPESAENSAEEAKPESEAERRIYSSRSEVLDRLAEIVKETSEQAKLEINHLKMLYYKMRQQEVDAELKELLASENPEDAASFQTKPDELEPRLKELLAVQKEARAAMVEAREREWASNLAAKQDVLRRMEEIASDATDVSQQYNAFIELQKKFKEIGEVAPTEVNGLWKRYSSLGEQFYDLLKINKELRDYDFKKNLERKEALCAEAESLAEVNDVVAAFRRLQELHEEWKGLGPVAPAQREEIWSRFKAASTVVNKRHQNHFEKIKEQEAVNEEGKKALCDKIEAIDIAAIKDPKEWDEQTAVVIGLQQEWRKLGFANRKVNSALFERFRHACDAFFSAKAEHYKGIRTEMEENLRRKFALCEKAEAMKDSTEWRTTTDKFVSLQKEWKSIGPVPRRQSNAIWQRFSSACDAFFAAKEAAVGSERAEEKANKEKKEAILARLDELKAKIEDATPQAVRQLMAEWNEVGHVPFKDKDRLFREYQDRLQVFFDKLDMHGVQTRVGNFKQSVSRRMADASKKADDVVLTERQKLARTYERLSQDLKTYENNLGFFAHTSAKGNALLAQMEKKRDALKRELDEVVAKIKAVEKLDEEK